MAATPKKKRALPVAIGIALTALVAFIAPRLPFINQIELLSFDARMRLAPAMPVSDAVVHVDIDDSSILGLGRWPWDRNVHAHFLDMMTLLGAEYVVFDVEFPEEQKPFIPALGAAGIKRIAEEHAAAYAGELDRLSRAAATGHADSADAADPFAAFSMKEKKFQAEMKETVDGMIVDYDDTFVQSIRRHGGVIIGFGVFRPGQAAPSTLPVQEWEDRAALGPAGAEGPAAASVMPPIKPIGQAAYAFGTTTIEPDPDGVTRRVVLLWNYEGKRYAHLGFTAALKHLGIPPESVRWENGFVRAGDMLIPTDSQGRMLILWKQGPTGAIWINMFHHLPYGEVCTLWQIFRNLDQTMEELETAWPSKTMFGGWRKRRDAWREALDKAAKAPREGRAESLAAALRAVRAEEASLFDSLEKKADDLEKKDASGKHRQLLETVLPLLKYAKDLHGKAERQEAKLRAAVAGKVCIVGSAHHASTDFHAMPLRPAEKLPGVSIHSNVFNMVANQKFMAFAPGWVAIALALGFGALTTLLGMRLNALAGGLVAGGGVAAYALLCLFFFSRGTLFPFVVPALGAALPFISVAIIRAFTEEKQKREIRKLFEHYVDPTLVDQLVENPTLVGLAGREREGSVLFADVAGFTNFSFATPAEEAVHFVNHYLSIGTRFILNHKGYLDKYMGDGIMAIFGAPLPLPDHAAQACLVALELQNNIVGDELGKLFLQRAGKPFVIRVGITAGRFVAGNIGSDRVSYTAIGDNVNLAARLQSAGKELDSHMLCNEEAALAARSAVETRPMGIFTVRGREAIVKVHEILCVKGALTPAQVEFLKWYEEGLQAYLDRKWDVAIEALRKADTLKPRDKATSIYIKRAEAYRANPPEKIEAIPL